MKKQLPLSAKRRLWLTADQDARGLLRVFSGHGTRNFKRVKTDDETPDVEVLCYEK